VKRTKEELQEVKLFKNHPLFDKTFGMSRGKARLTVTAFAVALLALSSAVAEVHATIDWTREDQYLTAALNNIENSRKLDVNLRFFGNVSSRPITNAVVSYKQLSHDFVFAVGGADVAGTGLSLDAFEIWPLNWSYIEPRKGVFNFQKYDAYLQQLESRTPNGQFFVKMWVVPEAGWIYKTWPPAYAQFDKIADPEVFQEFLGHVYDFVYHSALHFKGRIRFWIIQMEMNAPVYAVAEAGRLLWTVQQGVEIDFAAAKAIRDANKDAVILIGTSNPQHVAPSGELADPLDFTQMCLTRGVDFDGVAIEAWPIADTPADYYYYMSEFADLGKYVFIHETQGFAAPPDPSASGWKWNVFDEDAQAEWLRRIFTIAYGSKAAIGVQWLWYEDSQQYQQGQFFANGLVDHNGHPRKAYYAFQELIQNFTSCGHTVTNADGEMRFRGFAGRYEIAVPGYQTVMMNVTEGRENTYDLRLTPSPYASSMTVSYQVVGGGTGYSAPSFNYVQLGVSEDVPLTGTATTIVVDKGSAWSVTPNPLTGSDSSQRWFSSQLLSGKASGSKTIVFTFFHQYNQTVSYAVVGGGSPPAPSFTANQFGKRVAEKLASAAKGYWFDAGSAWSVTNPLTGSSASQRWIASQSTSGTVNSAQTIVFSYQHQYYLTMKADSPAGGTVTPSSGWQNAGASVPIQAYPNSGYVFTRWTGSGTGSYSGTTNPDTVTMNGPITEAAQFQIQLAITQIIPTNGADLTGSTTVRFTVQVTSEVDGKPVQGATVTIYVNGTKACTGSTNSTGYYTCNTYKPTKSGTYLWYATASKTSYQPVTSATHQFTWKKT
jgi:hypothetical protein